MAIARTRAQKAAGLTLTQAKAMNAGKTDAQILASVATQNKDAPSSSGSGVDGLPMRNEQQVNPYGYYGTKENQFPNTPTNQRAPSVVENVDTFKGAKQNSSFQYVDKEGKVKTVSAFSEEEARALATDIDPKSGFMLIDPVYASQKQNGITSSSTNARTEESRLGKAITTLSSPGYSTPARSTKYIDDYDKSLTQLLSASERDINASADETKRTTEAAQAEDMGAASAKLARMGGYLGDSASGTGALLKLSAGHRAELSSLESKRMSALTNARTAFAEKRFDAAKAKVAEAKYYDEELYKRQQDFFDNQRALLGDERTQTNQERDDARSVITNIVSASSGQDWNELGAETQKALEENALKAGYPIDVLKNMLAKPKALAGKIDSLIKDAAKKGAPASILAAISEADSFSEAATIASPYLAAGSGGDETYAPVSIPEYDAFVVEFLSTPGGQAMKKQVEGAARTNFTPEQLIIELKKNPQLKSIYDSTVAKVQSSVKVTPFTPVEKKKLEQAGLLGAARQKQLDHLYAKSDSLDTDIDDISK